MGFRRPCRRRRGAARRRRPRRPWRRRWPSRTAASWPCRRRWPSRRPAGAPSCCTRCTWAWRRGRWVEPGTNTHTKEFRVDGRWACPRRWAEPRVRLGKSEEDRFSVGRAREHLDIRSLIWWTTTSSLSIANEKSRKQGTSPLRFHVAY